MSSTKYCLYFCAILCVMCFWSISVQGLGIRAFGSVTSSSSCSNETRRAAIGCPCRLVGVPCGPAFSICATATTAKNGLPGVCVALGVTIVAPIENTVSATACPGDNVQTLACGGTQPISCTLTFLGTTSTDASGNLYTASQIFLSVVNAASGCCYVTPTNVAPSTDALECFTATASDASGSSTSDIVCFDIKAPPANFACPLKLSPSTQNAFVFSCNAGAASVTVLQLTPSGGTAPFAYSLALASNSVKSGDGTDFGALVQVDSNTGRVFSAFAPDVTVTQCYVATVTDAKQGKATTSFCVTLQGGNPGDPKVCPP